MEDDLAAGIAVVAVGILDDPNLFPLALNAVVVVDVFGQPGLVVASTGVGADQGTWSSNCSSTPEAVIHESLYEATSASDHCLRIAPLFPADPLTCIHPRATNVSSRLPYC